MAHKIASHWKHLEDSTIKCTLCPRECKINEGRRGSCFVRKVEDGQLILDPYGTISTPAVDPIEKKPLYHFLPGTTTLSFGTVGCNLACKFCQNWDMSHGKSVDMGFRKYDPQEVVEIAIAQRCKSISFTYNDPVIFLEYAKEVAYLAHEQKIKTVAVTAGYLNQKAREDFFSFIDGANIDLKAFTDKFYQQLTGGSLGPVKDTLQYLASETSVWFEITNLLIPGHNDSIREIEAMCSWIYDTLGENIPLHFSAFHGAGKMVNMPRTSLQSLIAARDVAIKCGVKYVYIGNVDFSEGQSSFCKKCGNKLIERSWYDLNISGINKLGSCLTCGMQFDGIFD